jgi:hypothetical protein
LVDRDRTALITRHGAGLEVLATSRLDDPIDASAAIADPQMFLHGRRHLCCLDAPTEGGSDAARAPGKNF